MHMSDFDMISDAIHILVALLASRNRADETSILSRTRWADYPESYTFIIVGTNDKKDNFILVEVPRLVCAVIVYH